MKDIRSLYRNAKTTGREVAISSYKEAVEELVQNHPFDYILQLEYIISSEVGFSTLDSFLERYGLCIPVCQLLLEAVEEGKIVSSRHQSYCAIYQQLKNVKEWELDP